MTSCMCSFTEC